jgi:hypothetical protein
MWGIAGSPTGLFADAQAIYRDSTEHTCSNLSGIADSVNGLLADPQGLYRVYLEQSVEDSW